VRPTNPDRLIENVGRRIAETRREQELTQQQLADAVGVTLRYVQSVEAGRENLSLRSLVAWANVLEVAVPALLEPATTRKSSVGRPRTGVKKG
jgi:transcriptional regulator with XRE-family HTH domain